MNNQIKLRSRWGEPVSVNEKVFDALVQFQYERN